MIIIYGLLCVFIGWTLKNIQFSKKLQQAHLKIGEMLLEMTPDIINQEFPNEKSTPEKIKATIDKIYEQKSKLGEITGRMEVIQELR